LDNTLWWSLKASKHTIVVGFLPKTNKFLSLNVGGVALRTLIVYWFSLGTIFFEKESNSKEISDLNMEPNVNICSVH